MIKVMTAGDAVRNYIKDGMTIATNGFVGAVHPEGMVKAIQECFLREGSPRDLTLIHSAGQGGGKDEEGNVVGQLNRLAEEGLLKCVIGGHFGLAPRIQKLIIENKVAAYNMPQGCISELFRDIAGHRPGLVTHVGLNTFVDPDVEGGMLNDKARELGSFVKKINFNGEEKLFYPSIPIDVTLIHASYVDTEGNCSLEREGTLADILPICQAAYNSGGKVIVTVEKDHFVQYGSIDIRMIQVPGIYVEAVVLVEKDHAMQTNTTYHNPAFSGHKKAPLSAMEAMKMNPRKVIARRCAKELKAGAIVNLGIGMPEGVANVVAEEGISGMVLTTESGTIGGVPASGGDFGVTTNPDAIIQQSFQFDFYDGGGLDIAFLGLAQCDSHGNINVSRFGPRIAGCGGFINITQNTKDVVFCGTFTVKGGKKKFLKDVEQITFSADFANRTGQRVLYVTERAVFKLTEEGLELTEIAPGIDIDKDILPYMEFVPIMKNVKEMDPWVFRD